MATNTETNVRENRDVKEVRAFGVAESSSDFSSGVPRIFDIEILAIAECVVGR